eukprot:GCRY01000694.1.p1 GENE.GCRY01000694.1~~GCRY01000694.1.p1  ORF type:complete len:314 (+),score=77.77 GCRY01000694.1:89-1030(+)
MGLSREDLVEIPKKVCVWLRDKLLELVKAVLKKLGCLVCLDWGIMKSGVGVVKGLEGLDDGFDKLKDAAEEHEAEDENSPSIFKFTWDIIKTVADNVADAMSAVTEFLAKAAKKMSEEALDEAKDCAEAMGDFMKLLVGGGFSFSLPSFDNWKSFKKDLIPDALKEAPVKLFMLLSKMGDKIVETFAASSMALLSLVMPMRMVEEGAVPRMKEIVADEDDIALGSMLGLVRIGIASEEHEDEIKDFLKETSENDDSDIKKGLAATALAMLIAGEFLEDALSDVGSAVSDALSDVGDALEDVADGIGNFAKKLF